MAGRIDQTLDEGQSGDERKLALADLRGAIRAEITNQDGTISWKAAKHIATSCVPPMAPSTVINFASGKSKVPHHYTTGPIDQYLRGKPRKLVYVDADYKLPKKANAIEVT